MLATTSQSDKSQLISHPNCQSTCDFVVLSEAIKKQLQAMPQEKI